MTSKNINDPSGISLQGADDKSASLKARDEKARILPSKNSDRSVALFSLRKHYLSLPKFIISNL